MTKITTITLTCPKPPQRVEAMVAVPAAPGDGRGLKTRWSRALGMFSYFYFYILY